MKYRHILPVLILLFTGILTSGFNSGSNYINFSDSLSFFRNPEITDNEIYHHIKYLASDELEGREPGTDGDYLSRAYISNEYELYGLEPIGDSAYIQFFDIKIKKQKVNTANIIGYLEGSDSILKNEIIVIGAHYDHIGYGDYASRQSGKTKMIHNGADDNASGVTGVLELAQKLSADKPNLRRSYIFACFGAEERGLLGSKYFTESDIFRHYNIVAMINLDMIGRLENNSLVINGTGTSSIWDDLIKEVNKKYDFKITSIPDGIGGSDHTSFTLKDIPVLFFFTGIHDDYHMPSDDYDKINTKSQERILNFVYDILIKTDRAEQKPDFAVNSDNRQNRQTTSFKVSVGTIPDFSYSGDGGFKISGVRSGSPAEKAGLKGGDLIIKFAGKDIKNIYDYTSVLSELKSGDEVPMTINREGHELEVTIKLESR